MVEINERQIGKAVNAAIFEAITTNDGLCMDSGDDRRTMYVAIRDLIANKLSKYGIDVAIFKGLFDSEDTDPIF